MLQQLDMFAMMAPPPAPPCPTALAAEERRLARLAEWQAERDHTEAAVSAGRAAGNARTLSWGDPGAWSKPGLLVELVQHEGSIYAYQRLSANNMGSSGPFSRLRDITDLDGAQRHMFRDLLDRCALYTDGSWKSDKVAARQLGQLAQWILTQSPELVTDWAALRTEKRDEAQRRGAALGAAHRIEEAAKAALQAENLWAYDSLIIDRSKAKSQLTYQDQFRAEYHVIGSVASGFQIVIYGKKDLDPANEPACLRALDVIRAALPAQPVRFAEAGEYALCHVDRRKVTW